MAYETVILYIQYILLLRSLVGALSVTERELLKGHSRETVHLKVSIRYYRGKIRPPCPAYVQVPVW